MTGIDSPVHRTIEDRLQQVAIRASVKKWLILMLAVIGSAAPLIGQLPDTQVPLSQLPLSPGQQRTPGPPSTGEAYLRLDVLEWTAVITILSNIHHRGIRLKTRLTSGVRRSTANANRLQNFRSM